jgi:hypothetical protein
MATYFKAPLVDVDSQQQRGTTSNIFKVGIALVGGSCLVLMSVMAMSAYNTSAVEETNLITMPSLRANPMASMIRNLPGSGPFKDLTLAALQDSNRCPANGAPAYPRMTAMMANMRGPDRAMVTAAGDLVGNRASDILKAGQVAPLGFWDPWGLSTVATEGRLLFYREAEIKHGRVCMLAVLGMLVTESGFHPLFGGGIDVASVKVFEQMDLAAFWPAAFVQFMFAAFWEEKRTAFGGNGKPVIEGKAFGGLNPAGMDVAEVFSAKGGRIPGDVGFDPLGLKPKKEADLLELQNKEILNGRLAMIAAAGIVSQELVTGQKVFR